MRAFTYGLQYRARTSFPRNALVLVVAGLSACATVVTPNDVRFASLYPGSETLSMFDTRPTQAREYREEGKFRFLGDGGMQPNPVALVASRIAESLPASRRERPVELRRLDIGFLVSPRSLLPTSTGTTISTPQGSAASAIVAGLTIAYGMIAALTRSRADESGVAYIEVWVGGDQLRAARTVPFGRNSTAPEALEAALAAALDELAAQAKALPLPAARIE
jgi:hypothetical protein